jgi:DNA end-binding protein Ku
MRAIWKGNISFALVTIPISVFSATRSREVSFKYLHKEDLSPVSYKRFCDAEDREVPWEEITRGYEYEKGRFVEVTDEEFKRANAELTRTIRVVEFVDEHEIDSVYYDKPYYLEPQKGAEHAYALMRDALAAADKIGIARVVLKAREHLAVLKPVGKMLTLQMIRFAHEIVKPDALNLPALAEASEKEMALAETLIETMTDAFDPAKYQDTYHDQLLELIQQKVAGVTPEEGEAPSPRPGKVVDLMEVLKQSLNAKGKPRRAVREKTVAAPSRQSPRKKRVKKSK